MSAGDNIYHGREFIGDDGIRIIYLDAEDKFFLQVKDELTEWLWNCLDDDYKLEGNNMRFLDLDGFTVRNKYLSIEECDKVNHIFQQIKKKLYKQFVEN